MRIKEGFVLRKIMGNYVAVATGEAGKRFRGMITLNSTAADIWRHIEDGMSEEEILSALLDEYEVDGETARRDLMATLEMLRENGILEDE